VGSPCTTPLRVQRCTRCGELKEAAEFYVRPFTRTGLASICRQCTSVQAKGYRVRRARERLQRQVIRESPYQQCEWARERRVKNVRSHVNRVNATMCTNLCATCDQRQDACQKSNNRISGVLLSDIATSCGRRGPRGFNRNKIAFIFNWPDQMVYNILKLC
jgi:hypothetical protein